MDPTAKFQENLRRLAMIDDGFVEDQARLGLALDTASALDPKTAALLQLGASVAAGSPGVCLEWSTTRALAAGASEDEIADVLLAIAPVTGLGRVVAAAPEVATAPGLQRVRGPYTIRTGLAAYEAHLSQHHPGRDGFPAGTIPDAG
jgi:alkylhydroperoxidase/carboxymuconolactone decarboxylase family protein YurZ